VSASRLVELPAWVVRLGGGLRLRATRRETIAVERLGHLADVDVEAALREPVPDLPPFDVRRATNPGDRRALAALAAYLKPSRILEIGTHVGASTMALAIAAPVVSVDVLDVNAADGPWREVGAAEAPADLARRLGLADHIRFVQSPSLPFLRTTTDSFDLIFLDGDHSAAAVYREFAAASRIVRQGGYIVLHDYFPRGEPVLAGESAIPGPYRALARACHEAPGLGVRPLGALPWPTKRGSHMTTLAIAARLEPQAMANRVVPGGEG